MNTPAVVISQKQMLLLAYLFLIASQFEAGLLQQFSGTRGVAL